MLKLTLYKAKLLFLSNLAFLIQFFKCLFFGIIFV